MKDITIQYQTSVVVLPGKVTEVLDRASLEDLRVLLTLCADSELCHDCEAEGWQERVAERADCDPESVTAAVAFWRGAGILGAGKSRPKKSAASVQETAPPAKVAPEPAQTEEQASTQPQPRKVSRSPELPRYTTEELAALLESREDTLNFINECQRVWGKMFNSHEVNIMLGLVDYLGLEYDYVLSLLAYCSGSQERRGIQRSLRYVEKTAFALYDEGVQTIDALNEKIRQMDLMAEVEGQLRTLFGMGARALTPKEKKCFSAWLYDYGYGMEIIRMAYDITVDAKGAPNVSYMNSVLANWHKDGLRTPEEVQKAQETYKKASKADGKKVDDGSKGLSFDTEDFFAAAVRRNFGDNFSPNDSQK